MKYNPDRQLTDQEINSLPEKEFFEYLDSRTAYLKQFSKPAEGQDLKRFAIAASRLHGIDLTTQELEQVGRRGADARSQYISSNLSKLNKLNKK